MSLALLLLLSGCTTAPIASEVPSASDPTLTTASWTAPTEKTWGSQLCVVTMGYEYGEEFDEPHWYHFDITDAVQGWVDGTLDPNKGIIFKASSSLENGSTYQSRTMASFNRSSKKPSLMVTYCLATDLSDVLLDIDEGTSHHLLLTGSYDTSSITWESTHPAIATVNSNGLVTGHKAGIAYINVYIHGVFVNRCLVFVTLADGVYQISSNYSDNLLTVRNGLIRDGTTVMYQTLGYANTNLYSQLWKIEHLGRGYYSVRPMHMLSMAMTYNDGYVSAYKVEGTDSSTIPDNSEWAIYFSSNGYAVESRSLDRMMLCPENNGTSDYTSITLDQHDAEDPFQLWDFSPCASYPDALLVYETSTGKLITSKNEETVGISRTYSVDDMGIAVQAHSLNGLNSLAWLSSNETVAQIDISSGVISTISTGTTTISVSTLINNAAVEFTFSLRVILPVSSYELPYEPDSWNSFYYSNPYDIPNCYSYALNNQQYNMQPGKSVGNTIPGYSDISLETVIPRIAQDAAALGFTFEPISKDAVCPAGTYKIAVVVAPGNDYHFYRQNPDGTWSHKIGSGDVHNYDASGQIIYDPEFADRNYGEYFNYSEFGGFFCVSPLNLFYSGTQSSSQAPVSLDSAVTQVSAFTSRNYHPYMEALA